MRTTLTLDDDVAAAVERRRREHQHSLKHEVNELLRVGLLNVDREEPASPGLRVEPWDGGECLFPNIDNVAEVLSIVEGDDHR
jgi:plasmid stability protein